MKGKKGKWWRKPTLGQQMQDQDFGVICHCHAYKTDLS